MPRQKNDRSSRSRERNGATVGYEAQFWQMADALRGSMDAAEYKHVVLGLIFLQYISDAFEEQHTRLEAECSQGADPEDPDEDRALNIFWVPPRGPLGAPEGPGQAVHHRGVVDDAMATIEHDNPSLKGVLSTRQSAPQYLRLRRRAAQGRPALEVRRGHPPAMPTSLGSRTGFTIWPPRAWPASCRQRLHVLEPVRRVGDPEEHGRIRPCGLHRQHLPRLARNRRGGPTCPPGRRADTEVCPYVSARQKGRHRGLPLRVRPAEGQTQRSALRIQTSPASAKARPWRVLRPTHLISTTLYRPICGEINEIVPRSFGEGRSLQERGTRVVLFSGWVGVPGSFGIDGPGFVRGCPVAPHLAEVLCLTGRGQSV